MSSNKKKKKKKKDFMRKKCFNPLKQLHYSTVDYHKSNGCFEIFIYNFVLFVSVKNRPLLVVSCKMKHQRPALLYPSNTVRTRVG
jgi:hypothetical protein